jgi:predicted phage tail component-like protein
VANYNSGVLYNFKLPSGGANYNSAPFLIWVHVKDKAAIEEHVSLEVHVNISDSGQFDDDKLFATSAYFFVTDENILIPLNVYVSGDSRNELIPSTRDVTEEIPGRHGELDFGTELKPRVLELVCRTKDGLTPQEKYALKRALADYLNPIKGVKSLVFSDDIYKSYKVKFSGKLEPKDYPGWFEFSIPFKMPDPFIVGSFQNELVGSGTILNEGNVDTHVIIEISGPVTDQAFEIGEDSYTFVGTINDGETVIIDTGNITAKKGTTNVFAGFASAFATGDIVLAPGLTTVSATTNVKFKWRNKWL